MGSTRMPDAGGENLTALMTGWRHELHRRPELGFKEVVTSAQVADLLKSFGLEVHEGIGGTGIVAVLRGNGRSGTGRAIALRADMDALPIEEKGNVPYRSCHEGRMHACGHDGHMAMLLGAAAMLCDHSSVKNSNWTVVFIFQPAEEHGLGAQAMIDDGLFERFPVSEVFGMHNLPGLPLGSFATRSGAFCASESLFEITIRARGGHSAMPHMGVDAILVGSTMVQELQSIVARKLPPGAGCVVSVTEFLTDGRRNVLPGNATLKGDVRAPTPELRQRVEAAMRTIVEGIAMTHGVETDFSFTTEFIEVVNAAEQTEAAVRAARSVFDTVDDRSVPMTFSEDFARFAAVKPACFALIGNGTQGCNGHALHSDAYDFNDAALPLGATYWARLVEERLACREG